MAALEVLQAAQLEFVSPSASSNFVAGQVVNVTWNTPWEFTNLEVLQGPLADGSYALSTLGASLAPSETTYLWNTSSLPLGGSDDSSTPFHFRLQKTNLPNDCETCATDSPAFSIAQREPVASTTFSSTAATTAAPTTSPTIANVATATSSNLASTSSNTHSGLSSDAKLGIGLGIGLGGALLITLLALVLLLVRRRKRNQEPTFLAVHRPTQKKQMATQTPHFEAPAPPVAQSRPPTTDHHSRFSGVAASFSTKSSGKTRSYHGPFEFEDANHLGTLRPGSESLFTHHHPVMSERMPSLPNRFPS